MAALGCSGMPKDQWPEVLLKHISPPALHKIAGTYQGNADLILDDLCTNYGDPHTIMANLFKCHMDLGPVPDPAIYKQAALNLARSHSRVLVSSVALLNCADTPGASDSVYSNNFCKMLVDLLPQGIKRRNPLLSDPSKSTRQSNINRYEAFTHNIKTWITLLPYEISQDASQMNMFTLPTNALAQDLVSQTELVLMITETTQETTQVPDIDHLEPAASPPSTAWQANAGVPIQTD